MSRKNSEFKVLFVDNSRTMRASMAKILEQAGFLVETAGSGEEAVEQAETGQYSIIVMDLFMPKMNGYEAAKRIRSLTDSSVKKIPIIALTASQSQSDIKISQDAGMNEFLVKDTNNAELIALLEKYKSAH